MAGSSQDYDLVEFYEYIQNLKNANDNDIDKFLDSSLKPSVNVAYVNVR